MIAKVVKDLHQFTCQWFYSKDDFALINMQSLSLTVSSACLWHWQIKNKPELKFK